MNKYLFFVVILTTAGSVSPLVEAADLERLFLTSADRSALDKARRQRDQAMTQPIEPEVVVVPEPEVLIREPVRPSIHLDGYVKRSGTTGTVWINGVSSYDGDLSPLDVDHNHTKIVGKRVSVTPLSDSPKVLLKPGQTYNPSQQEMADAYQLPEVLPAGAVDRKR